jgi:MFS family permease
LALLLAVNLLNYIDRSNLAAVVTRIRAHFFAAPADPAGGFAANLMNWMHDSFGLTPERALIGSLGTAFMVSYMITAPVFARLAERYSRWRLVGVGVILWSLASAASGLSGEPRLGWTFGALFLTRCCVGIGEGAYGPVAPTMIADLYPVQNRGYVLAWFYTAIPVGSALGYLLGGLAADRLSWPWAFYLVLPPGLVLGLLCFFMREAPLGQADAIQAPRPRARDYIVLVRTPSYVLNTLGMAAMTFAIGGMAFWMPDYIHDYRQVPNLERVNLVFGAIVLVTGLVATLLGGFVGDALRRRFPGSYFLISAAAMFSAFPLTLAVLVVAFPWAWGLLFLACFCLFFNTGPTNTILANVTHPSIRSMGFAVNIFIIHALGDVPSPLLIGLVADAWGMTRAFLVVSGAILAAAIFWLYGTRYLARDTALALSRLR